MKHFTQTTANGLHTPPCGSSHGKSTRFFFLTLLLGLLTFGSTSAWGRTPTIFGEGLPGLNASGASNWDSNTKVMQSMGEDGYWYAEFLNVPATDNNKYRFKIAINDGNWWDGAMVGISTNDANNFGNLDRSKSNVLFVSGGGSNENRISFKMPFDGDVYVFYKASEAKVWVVAVPQNVAAAPNNSGTRKLKTDIILKDGSNDWSSDGIKFEKNDAVSTYKHVTSYILPTRKSTETSAAIRFEMCYGSTPDVYISGKSDGRPAALSSLTPRRIIYLWDGNNHNNNTDNNNVGWISYTLPTYPMRKSGWKLFVKDYNSGNPTTMDANGSATLTLNGGSSYEFFIANTDYATNLSTYSQSAAATYPAVHSVNWFGGCYIDQSNSSNVTFNDIQVYKSDKLGTLTHPVVDSHHLQGKFQVSGSGSKDVTFTFDGGKITINAVDHVESFTDEVYVYGAGGTNWVTGWSKPVEAYKMSISAGVASKTFYNVTGNGLNFKVWNKTKSSDIDWSDYSSSKSDVTCTNCSSNNICFDLGSNVYDVTVYTDGTEVWVKAKQHKSSLSGSYTVSGDFQGGWSNNGNQMLWTDDAKGYTYTIHNVSSNYTKNGHGWQRFKIFQYNTWTAECTANTATIIGLDGTVIGSVSDDKESDEGRIIVQVDEASDITFTYYQYTNGTKIVTIKRSAAAVTHTVTFDSNGGSSVANQEVEDGGKAIQPANPTKSGYTFNYWKLSGESTEFDFNTTITGNITLVADWSAVPAVNYNGGEIFYFHKKGGSIGWNSVYSGDAAVFLEFSNTDESSTARSTKVAYFWDTDNTNGDILATRVPAGTWNKVRVKRYGWNTGNQTLGDDYGNNSNWVTLESGKNYLNGSNTMDVYSNPRTFHFYISGSTALANTGSEFNAWNGNGTAHSGSITKTLNAGNEYKFKLNPTGTQDWRSQFNWNDIDAANSSNNINLRKNPANDNTEIWFDLSRKSDVTIACDGIKVTVNATPYYNVTFNSDGGSDVDAQSILSGGTVTEPSDPTRGSGYTFNFWKLSGESSAYDFSTPVTSDIELVADWTAPTLYTVTFDSNGGSPVDAQEVVENETATEPAAPTRDNYTFGGWKLGNALYDFATPVTDDIELVADWSYTPAHISSVSINESSIYTWTGDAITYTLVPTLVPADIASVTVSWSSSDNNVATVENGVITPQRAGTATITCTATDYYSGSQTATCAVKVAPCAKELAGAPSYNVTITGYNSYEDGDATLTGLWNESSDNTEPATLTVCNVRIGNNGGSNEYYAYDNNGTVSIEQRSSDNVDKWYRIEAATNLYYLKNVSTGKYMYVGPTNTSGSKGIGWTTNSGWYLRSVFTSAANGKTDNYKFYCTKDEWNNDIIVSRADATNNTSRVQENDFVLSRQQLISNPGNVWNDVVANMVAASRGATQGGNNYKGFQSAFENVENVTNPAYIQSQMNSSYYRMKANATVQANLGSALAEADVISVELYADAATSVTLCKSNGDVVATINLNADAAIEYTYLVTAGTPLDGENAFIIKAADNHAGIRSIAVTPMVTADPAQPDLHWTTTPVTAHLLLDGNFTYTAASNDSQGAISYASEDTDVAQVDASTGEVTPSGAGTTNIIATITADECYTTYSISYEVSFLGLQDYIATDGVNSVTLPGDYAGENIVINKPFTINGNDHSIGNLTVENSGDLTLSGNLTVNDFSIYAKAGNSEHQAASGQVREASNLTVNGNAYFLYTVDPSGTVHYGWYDFTVPFPVNVMSGIAGIDGSGLNENFVNERDYAIMEFLGDKKAAGQYAYKKFRGIMQPGILYSITLDNDYNYNTIRFKKTDGALAPIASVDLPGHSGEISTKENWNGVGNGSLHHINIGGVSPDVVIQVYQSGDKSFKPVSPSSYSFAVGVAFMIQGIGTMTLNQATHSPLLAPRRAASAPQRTAIQIAGEGKPFSDQLFISADEMAGQAYTQGVDVAKAGDLGSAKVAQLWTNAYNTPLCAHEAQLINGEAHYALSIYAPANGSYTLTSQNIPDGATLYLTQNGNMIWDLSEAYTLDLTKGTNTEYGLLLVESHKIPTGVDAINSNADTKKIMRNSILYILRNGKVFNAQGARVQ